MNSEARSLRMVSRAGFCLAPQTQKRTLIVGITGDGYVPVVEDAVTDGRDVLAGVRSLIGLPSVVLDLPVRHFRRSPGPGAGAVAPGVRVRGRRADSHGDDRAARIPARSTAARRGLARARRIRSRASTRFRCARSASGWSTGVWRARSRPRACGAASRWRGSTFRAGPVCASAARSTRSRPATPCPSSLLDPPGVVGRGGRRREREAPPDARGRGPVRRILPEAARDAAACPASGLRWNPGAPRRGSPRDANVPGRALGAGLAGRRAATLPRRHRQRSIAGRT